MGLLKTAVSLVANGSKQGLQSTGNRGLRPLLSCAPLAMALDRGAHSQDLTKNIQFISNDKQKLRVVDPNTMKLDKPLQRPVCVMINWLLARHKHVMKYATLYLEQGFDVVSVSCTPWQLMWPLKGSQLVAGDLINLMAANENEHPLVVHGFSVGGYIWGEVCVHVMRNPKLYQPQMDRVAAQVWDSAADITEITVGVPAAVFPNNSLMQRTLQTYMEYHMKTFHEAATSHYVRSSQLFHTNLCRAPALFLLSGSDPVGAERSNRSVHDSWAEMGIQVIEYGDIWRHDNWAEMGIQCTWKCWDRSPHVQHYIHHPKEYLQALYSHLDKAGLVSQPDKMALRL